MKENQRLIWSENPQIKRCSSSPSVVQVGEAADFLRDELADGQVEAAQVWRHAREAGLAEATLKRAKAMC